jgi:hypothetical protein
MGERAKTIQISIYVVACFFLPLPFTPSFFLPFFLSFLLCLCLFSSLILAYKEKKRYWELKEEALDRTLWRTRFGRGYGPVVRQTTE